MILFEEILLPYGIFGLIILSFWNSSISIVPTEILLIPLVLANPSKAFEYAFASTAASVAGAVFAYYLGKHGFEGWVEWFTPDKYFEKAEKYLEKHGVLIVGVSGISPLPFKVFCITSGVFNLNLRNVVLVSTFFRGFRFFSLAYLLAWFGEAFVSFAQNDFWKFSSLIGVLFILGYYMWTKYDDYIGGYLAGVEEKEGDVS